MKEKKFVREVVLYDDESTRMKEAFMEKWCIVGDDERNPDFEGLDEFLEFGKRYRVTIQEIGEAPVELGDE